MKKLPLFLIFLLILPIAFSYGRPTGQISSCDTGKTTLQSIDYDPVTRTFWIGDATEEEVYEFDANCNLLSNFDTSSQMALDAGPIGLTSNGTHIYALDSNDDDIKVYAQDGTYKGACSLPVRANNKPRELSFPPNGSTEEIWYNEDDTDTMYQGYFHGDNCPNWAGQNISWGGTGHTYGGIALMTDTNSRQHFLGYDPVNVYANDADTGADISYTVNRGFDYNITANGTIQTFRVDNTHFYVYGFNDTKTDESSSAPSILTYNLSAPSGDCTSWPSGTCTTDDTTPSVSITTDIDAHCIIGRVDGNWDYYDGSGEGGTCTGGGTISLICTLTPDDALTEENSNIYIACKDDFGNQGAASTSGALKVAIFTQDLERYGRTSIESGISLALSSGYAVYTDQKVYARNSANVQKIGIFDKVVKWMNKIWAFNVITGNDTFVNMVNITPVLYTLEMSNITNTSVNSTVYQFIIDTK